MDGNAHQAPDSLANSPEKRRAAPARKRNLWLLLMPSGCSAALFLFGWAIAESERAIPEFRYELISWGLLMMTLGFLGFVFWSPLAAYYGLLIYLHRRREATRSSDGG